MSANGIELRRIRTDGAMETEVELQNRLDFAAEARIGIHDGNHRSGLTGDKGLASRTAGLWVVRAPTLALRKPRSLSHDYHKDNRKIGQI